MHTLKRFRSTSARYELESDEEDLTDSDNDDIDSSGSSDDSSSEVGGESLKPCGSLASLNE